MGVKDYDLNPDNNTQINGINIAEGCPPSGINNAIRQLMADVKADSDAQNEALKTPASAENLGPVKVGDGLTMGEDGTLSANLATAEAAGLVKASETAKEGAVPLGGADGTLGEDWLKLAMDAAAAAQQAANNAQSDATKALSPAKKLGTRAGNTDSQWTLTNLTPGRLLVLLVDSTEPDDTETFIVFLSGTVTSNSERVTDYTYSIRIGKPSGASYFDPYSTVDIITNKTVVIKFFSGRANSKVSAYEV